MLSYFRNCKSCGYGIFQNQLKAIDFFCQRCWFELEKNKVASHTVIYKTPEVLVRPLFIWKDKESIVGDLIHGLKGGTPRNVLDRLSVEISMRSFTKESAIIVPVPSSKVGEKDHSYYIAKCISETLGFELWDGLLWKNKDRNQKFLNKTERFEIEMTKTKILPRKTRVILIDDLVTTGATAIAARKAIKSLNQIEVWALACRI